MYLIKYKKKKKESHGLHDSHYKSARQRILSKNQIICQRIKHFDIRTFDLKNFVFLVNIGSLEKRKRNQKKHAATNSLQFHAEMNTIVAVKQKLVFLFTLIMITGAYYRLINTFTMVHDLWTNAF